VKAALAKFVDAFGRLDIAFNNASLDHSLVGWFLPVAAVGSSPPFLTFV
jgi:hypothetical protein